MTAVPKITHTIFFSFSSQAWKDWEVIIKMKEGTPWREYSFIPSGVVVERKFPKDLEFLSHDGHPVKSILPNKKGRDKREEKGNLFDAPSYHVREFCEPGWHWWHIWRWIEGSGEDLSLPDGWHVRARMQQEQAVEKSQLLSALIVQQTAMLNQIMAQGGAVARRGWHQMVQFHVPKLAPEDDQEAYLNAFERTATAASLDLETVGYYSDSVC